VFDSDKNALGLNRCILDLPLTSLCYKCSLLFIIIQNSNKLFVRYRAEKKNFQYFIITHGRTHARTDSPKTECLRRLMVCVGIKLIETRTSLL